MQRNHLIIEQGPEQNSALLSVAASYETTVESNKSNRDGIRGTRLGSFLALSGISLALAAGGDSAKDLIEPSAAQAACVVEVEGSAGANCGSSDDGNQPEVKTPAPAPVQEPVVEDPVAKREISPKERKQKREARREKKANSQKDFKGYNMQASSFTSGNGCFITSVASALRRETGNRHIRPTSNRLYHPALQRQWNPTDGVTEGVLFKALPAMATRYNVQVSGGGSFDAKAVRKAIRQNDEVIILAQAGHFTGGGHYMAIRDMTKSGRFIIDDPNGTGRHGDSERRSGWSGAELEAGGVFDYRILHLRGVK